MNYNTRIPLFERRRLCKFYDDKHSNLENVNCLVILTFEFVLIKCRELLLGKYKDIFTNQAEHFVTLVINKCHIRNPILFFINLFYNNNDNFLRHLFIIEKQFYL